MYGVYSFLLALSLIFFYIPVYWVKYKIFRNQSIYIKERLGICLPPLKKGKHSIWFHAVSVGEVMSLKNLIQQLKNDHPDWTIYFSCLTHTGMKLAQEKLEGIDVLFYLPLDFKFTAKRYFKWLSPDVFVLAESEFWPNLLRTAKAFERPVVVINGRISRKSYKNYRKVRFFIKRVLENIDIFYVQTERDKDRLINIGVSPEKISISGNLKSDLVLPDISEDQIISIKRELGFAQGKKVLVAGSIRKGEDEKILSAFSKALKRCSSSLLVIAPRHPERALEIENLCRNLGLKAVRKTKAASLIDWEVLILDTLGELSFFYALADAAFIGGSLIPWGGHNLLEPAYYGKPVYFGPHMDNFFALAERFLEKGAAEEIKNFDHLVDMFLMKDETKLRSMGEKARLVLRSLQGATVKTEKMLESLIEPLSGLKK